MKNYLILCLFVIVSVSANSQITIENPPIGFTTAPNVIIRKVELLDTATVLHFQTYGGGGASFSIPDKTFIQVAGENEKLFITHAEGVTINAWTSFGVKGDTCYKLYFPKIGKSTAKFDYGEANDGGSWFIYDIQLKASLEKTRIPKEIHGNWFDQSTGKLWISFFDSLVVYQNKLWKYKTIQLKNGEGTVKLLNASKETELSIKKTEKDSLTVQEKNGKQISCGKVAIQKFHNNELEKPYELPIFKQDSAIYSGYFKGYSPRYMDKTFTVAVDDIITGKQNTFLGKISDDGYFSIKLPLYYPHFVFIRSKYLNNAVFLEPGKELFHLIDPQSSSKVPLYMGDLAEINTDLNLLQPVNSYDYYDIRSKILDMKPLAYKTYLQSLQKKDLKALEDINQTRAFGTKALQVKKMELDYLYFYNLLGYQMSYESAYREKNKIPWNQRNIDLKIDSFPLDYFNFISNEYINNPLSVLTSSYSSFVNFLKYLPILRSPNFSVTPLKIANELEKEGYVFSESEKILYSKMKMEDSLKNAPENKILFEQNGSFINSFVVKYKDSLDILFKESNEKNIPVYPVMMGEYLTKKGVKITDDEIQKLKISEDFYKKNEFGKSYSDSVVKFMNNHNNAVNKLFTQYEKIARSENLDKKLGIKKGFISDIMDAQDLCRGIVEEMSPMNDNSLKSSLQEITTPFIANYIFYCNEQTKIKLEANKKKKDYIVNEVPKAGPEQLFDSIIKKYKGKVVYVDFWATWCGPCRSSIEQIAPLKEELAGENVVFVYITGPSSPENTWKNMIPNIKGEHYRVSNDDWNFLCSQFNISGIPHCTLVGKDGRVINPSLGFMANDAIKAELVKWMK